MKWDFPWDRSVNKKEEEEAEQQERKQSTNPQVFAVSSLSLFEERCDQNECPTTAHKENTNKQESA